MRKYRELEVEDLDQVHGGGLTLPPELTPGPSSPPGPPRFEDWRRSDDVDDRRGESYEESIAPHDTGSDQPLPDQSDSSLAKDAGIDDIGTSGGGDGQTDAGSGQAQGYGSDGGDLGAGGGGGGSEDGGGGGD